MDTLISFFISYGYWGMFFSAILAGSVAPFSSEVVLAGLQALSLDNWMLIIVASIGNTLGGLFNYELGYLGKTEWISKLFKIKEERMNLAMRKVKKYGVWMGLLCWMPILGTAFSIALGLMRFPLIATTLTFFVGKFLRYAILVMAVNQFI